MWLEETTVEDMAVAVAIVLLVGIALGSFAVDLGAATPDPVPFDDTVELGASMETEQEARQQGIVYVFSHYGVHVGIVAAGVGIAVAIEARLAAHSIGLGGLVALCVWCFSPNVVAHAGLVTMDVPAAVVLFAAGLGISYQLRRLYG